MNALKIGVVGTLALAASSFATTINPIGGDGPNTSLQDVLNGITVGGVSSVNVNTDQVNPDVAWQLTGSGTSAATMIIELAGYAPSNTFGIYDINNPMKKVQLFSGAASAGAKTAVSLDASNNVSVAFVSTGVQFSSSTFGYYLSGPGGTFYSDMTKNVDGADHMVAFAGKGDQVQLPNSPVGTWTSNEYALGWEDVTASGGADWDFQDMVVMVESVKPVPEPTTMGLMGLGLLGLVAAARRRNK